MAGDFNSWAAAGDVRWELFLASFGGEGVLVCAVPSNLILGLGGRFKFVTDKHEWFPVSPEAPNAARDAQGNVNLLIDPERTGAHLFEFHLSSPIDLSRNWKVEWGKDVLDVHLRPDGYFFNLRSDLPLGAIVRGEETVFRIFAPRASRVDLHLVSSLESDATPLHYPLIRRAEPLDHLRTAFDEATHSESSHVSTKSAPHNWQGAWEVTLDQNLDGWYYWYHIDGASGPFSNFDKHQRVLDPYALAAVSRDGPGIVVDKSRFSRAHRVFKTPPWQDLVIAEAHVRDLVERAPVECSREERRGFSGLRKWVESPDFHLRRLGVNCVELQPIHEYDSRTREEYAWGYMPVSWFAPASAYALDPLRASGIDELRDLVEAFHRHGMAVVIDVVFNHQGEPAGLMFADKHYYFTEDNAGHLSNWSGCGNDFRAASAMATRLIIDSCIHMMDCYAIDGFRFDLAELLGFEVLRTIEKALKQVKRDVILIAEPWSFRGHIAGQLSETGWSSWNDGYRNFLRDYVRGSGSAQQLEYFLKGSPWYFARWPAQTVNYTESHDDRTWIDVITEHSSGSGFNPTGTDRARTHLMAAVLFSSLGIPMIAAGQDFLRSKHGVTNTYLRGDLNALEYQRIRRYPGTHAYFAEWIAFRLSNEGHLLRQWSCPASGFFRSFGNSNTNALALLYNADGSQGPERLLFAVNSSLEDQVLSLPEEVISLTWRQVADHERFYSHSSKALTFKPTSELLLPSLSCFLWRC